MTPQRTMTPRRTVVRHAPGKLFVAGEYAVVDPGNPAILTAVDRHIGVTVSGTGDAPGPGESAVVISTDLGSQNVPWRWHEGRLVVCGPDGEQEAGKGLAYVASAVETVGRLLTELGLPVPALNIAITSRLHDNGRKYGLGSSGAVTVATVFPLVVAAYLGTGDVRPSSGRILSAYVTAEAEASRPWFRRLRELAGKHGLGELSMGTSQDWRVAVEEGATLIRIGSLLVRD